MDWRLKAGVQGLMAMLPRSADLNRVFQRHVTRSLDVTSQTVVSKWDQTRQLVSMWRDASGVDGDFSALEVGTGWLPIAPPALRAAGAGSVLTLDIEDLLAENEVRQTLALVAEGLESGELACEEPDLAPVLRAGLELRSSPRDMLAACGVEPIVGDATSTILPSGSVDLSVSNNTLEHIPEPVLTGVYAELRRLASPRGASAHFIDLKDHYAGFDASIDVYNFLAYSDREWRRYNNSLQYQNRLRASDHRRLAESAGLVVAAELVERGDVARLPTRGLAPRFEGYGADDLLVHSQWLLLTPTAH